IAAVCEQVHGKPFSDKCLERIKDQGFISAVQYYFGLHYQADEMPQGNADFLKTMRSFGFGWFGKD
ncbi:MAG TPA: hypothetical protein VJ983_02410, partial [candidate division Zixibacteria bacterium]|nr:hypothetical protein [candidate division Zixibacteria bacterium]